MHLHWSILAMPPGDLFSDGLFCNRLCDRANSARVHNFCMWTSTIVSRFLFHPYMYVKFSSPLFQPYVIFYNRTVTHEDIAFQMTTIQLHVKNKVEFFNISKM